MQSACIYLKLLYKIECLTLTSSSYYKGFIFVVIKKYRNIPYNSLRYKKFYRQYRDSTFLMDVNIVLCFILIKNAIFSIKSPLKCQILNRYSLMFGEY